MVGCNASNALQKRQPSPAADFSPPARISQNYHFPSRCEDLRNQFAKVDAACIGSDKYLFHNCLFLFVSKFANIRQISNNFSQYLKILQNPLAWHTRTLLPVQRPQILFVRQIACPSVFSFRYTAPTGHQTARKETGLLPQSQPLLPLASSTSWRVARECLLKPRR